MDGSRGVRGAEVRVILNDIPRSSTRAHFIVHVWGVRVVLQMWICGDALTEMGHLKSSLVDSVIIRTYINIY